MTLKDKYYNWNEGDIIPSSNIYYKEKDVAKSVKELKDYLEIVKALDSGITNTLVDGKEDEELMKYTEKIVALVVDGIEKEIDKIFGEFK